MSKPAFLILSDDMLLFIVATLYLNKNAASMGRFSFLERDNQPPLGAIYFTLISGNLEQVIDYVAPRTANGEPIFSPDTLLE